MKLIIQVSAGLFCLSVMLLRKNKQGGQANDATTSKIMPSDNLVRVNMLKQYIQQNLKRGYRAEQISKVLLQNGYRKDEIDSAMR